VNAFTLEAELGTTAQPVWRLAFSPDGAVLATAEMDPRGPYEFFEGTGRIRFVRNSTVRFWDVGRRRLLGMLDRFRGSVDFFAFALGNRTVAMAGGHERMRRWDMASGQPLEFLDTEKATSTVPTALLPDRETLALAVRDDTVVYWNLSSGEITRRLSLPEWSRYADLLSVMTLAISPDGATLATAAFDSNWDRGGGSGGWEEEAVFLWDARDGRLKGTLVSRTSVEALRFSPDGATVAAFCSRMPGEADFEVRVWDLATRRLLTILAFDRAYMKQYGPHLEAFAFSADGRTLGVAHTYAVNGPRTRGRDVITSFEVRVFDTRDWGLLARIDADVALASRARLSFSGDLRRVATWDPVTSTVQVWRMRDRRW
jgi:hypothetical protein